MPYLPQSSVKPHFRQRTFQPGARVCGSIGPSLSITDQGAHALDVEVDEEPAFLLAERKIVPVADRLDLLWVKLLLPYNQRQTLARAALALLDEEIRGTRV